MQSRIIDRFCETNRADARVLPFLASHLFLAQMPSSVATTQPKMMIRNFLTTVFSSRKLRTAFTEIFLGRELLYGSDRRYITIACYFDRWRSKPVVLQKCLPGIQTLSGFKSHSWLIAFADTDKDHGQHCSSSEMARPRLPLTIVSRHPYASERLQVRLLISNYWQTQLQIGLFYYYG